MNPKATHTVSHTTRSSRKPKKHYDFVIILCPNTSNILGSFESYGQDGLYIGGDVRMQAAVDLYNTPGVTIGTFIVVGGGLKYSESEDQWRKTENMQQFLEKNDIPRAAITCVVSDSDTLGNFRAIWVTCRERLRSKKVGVLTNAYHSQRAMCIAADPQFGWSDVQFVPLRAEVLLTSNSSLNLPLKEEPALLGRVRIERQGVKDWRHDVYVRQHVASSNWRGKIRS